MINARWRLSIALVSGLLLVQGCGGTDVVDDAARTAAVFAGCDWVDNPGLIKDHLATVGSSPFLGNLSQARDSAVANGRAQLAATLKTRVEQLIEDWAKTAGDLNRAKETLTALVNNETFTRQFTNTEVLGTRPVRYCPSHSAELKPGDTIYALVVLENPVTWQENIDDSFEDALLRDEILWKTEALKAGARDRMDALKKENEQRRLEQMRAYSMTPSTPAPEPTPAPAPAETE
ncbi:MAG: hypothetical protein JXA90_16690 [Planctomycetes bacterium]|nr:hypothetical protein [Planctomycetota bacterium]